MGIQRNSIARILSPRAHSETTAVIPTSESAQIEISIQLCQYPENAKRWKRQWIWEHHRRLLGGSVIQTWVMKSLKNLPQNAQRHSSLHLNVILIASYMQIMI